MTQETRREIDNLLLSRPLSEIHGKEELHYLATIIQDHDHLREVLMTESNLAERRLKADAMRPYLRFKACSVGWYEARARVLGRGAVQPIDSEKFWYQDVKQYPRSIPHYE